MRCHTCSEWRSCLQLLSIKMVAAELNYFTNYNISWIGGVVLQPPQQTIYAAATGFLEGWMLCQTRQPAAGLIRIMQTGMRSDALAQ